MGADIFVFNNVSPCPLPQVKITDLTTERTVDGLRIKAEAVIQGDQAAFETWARREAAAGRILLIKENCRGT